MELSREQIIETTFNNTTKMVENMANELKKLYNLKEDDAQKIVFLIVQLKMGFELIIYGEDSQQLFSSSVCTINYIKNDKVKSIEDLQFNVAIEDLLHITKRPQMKVASLVEFIDIVIEYYPTRQMGLSLDIDWTK